MTVGEKFRGTDAIRRWSDAHFVGNSVKINVVDFHLTGECETVVISGATGETAEGAATYTFGLDGDQLTTLRIVA